MANTNVERLLELQRRILAERSRIVGNLVTHGAGDALPDDALRELAVLHGAASAVEEEIEAHTPTIGHGGEG